MVLDCTYALNYLATSKSVHLFKENGWLRNNQKIQTQFSNNSIAIDQVSVSSFYSK